MKNISIKIEKTIGDGPVYKIGGIGASWIMKATNQADPRFYLRGFNVRDRVAFATDGHRVHCCTAEMPDGYYIPLEGVVGRQWVEKVAPDVTGMEYATKVNYIKIWDDIARDPNRKSITVRFPRVKELSGSRDGDGQFDAAMVIAMGFSLDVRYVKDMLSFPAFKLPKTGDLEITWRDNHSAVLFAQTNREFAGVVMPVRGIAFDTPAKPEAGGGIVPWETATA